MISKFLAFYYYTMCLFIQQKPLKVGNDYPPYAGNGHV